MMGIIQNIYHWLFPKGLILKDSYGYTIFHKGYHSNYLALAISKGFDVNCKNKYGDTIFHSATIQSIYH